jgi:ribosomal protein S6
MRYEIVIIFNKNISRRTLYFVTMQILFNIKFNGGIIYNLDYKSTAPLIRKQKKKGIVSILCECSPSVAKEVNTNIKSSYYIHKGMVLLLK